VLLGGSTDHSVKTSTVFDVGYLSGVLLLPPDVRIGYNIISAGQLTHLRTVQNSDGTFYVLAIDGSIISRGRVGGDSIFYLNDTNLLLGPDVLKPSQRLVVSIISDSSTDALSDMAKVNVLTRRGGGIDLKGVRQSEPRIVVKDDRADTPSVTNISNADVMKSNDDQSSTDAIIRDGMEGTVGRKRTVSFSDPLITETFPDLVRADSSNPISTMISSNEDMSASGGVTKANDVQATSYETTDSGGVNNDNEVIIDNNVPTSFDDRNDDELSSNEQDVSTNHELTYPRKHVRYREYTSQPLRFRNDSNIMNFLHLRLGHQSDRTIKLMFKYNMITFLKDITYEKIKDKHSTPCAA
jgi:hypothetical protein